MTHPDSVQRSDPAPLRHPHHETARDRQRAAFEAEVAAAVARADRLRAALACARVLETRH